MPSATLRRALRRHAALLIAAPALAAAGAGTASAAPSPHGSGHHHAAHAGAHQSATSAPATGRAASTHDAHVAPAPAGDHAMFEVGSPSAPLVTRPGTGPLLRDASGDDRGDALGERIARAYVSGQLVARREAAAEGSELATRAGLSTAQATRKLTRRCQRLVKVRSTKKLSKADRKRRTACIAQRRAIMEAASRAVPAPASDATPGVSAPPAPIAGPTPTTAPPAGTTTPPAATTPTPPASPSPDAPSPAPAPVYGAVGVTAVEGGERFRLTRATVSADIVSFELVNTDAQQHDLYIAAADERGEISGPPVKIVGRIDGMSAGRPTRGTAEMTLAPGRYKLICTVPGHGKMTVDFTVTAPAR